MNNEQREQQMMTAAEAYAEEVGYKDEHDLCNTLNVFCAGWRAADNSRWIPVEKELPPKFGMYMFLLASGDMVYEVYYPDLKLVENVTHWMEIVPPRKEE